MTVTGCACHDGRGASYHTGWRNVLVFLCVVEVVQQDQTVAATARLAELDLPPV